MLFHRNTLSSKSLVNEGESVIFSKGVYFKDISYSRLKLNLIILYLLNLSDLFFTKVLLNTAPDMFREANIFLLPIVGGMAPYFLKIIVIGGVLYYWCFRSKESDKKDLKRSIIASIIMIVLYGAINLLHLFNVALLIYLK